MVYAMLIRPIKDKTAACGLPDTYPGDIDCAHAYSNGHAKDLMPVSRKCRKFLGLFQVPNFTLYPRNAGFLSYSNLAILLVFLTLKTC